MAAQAPDVVICAVCPERQPVQTPGHPDSELAEPASSIRVKGQNMEYKVLSGPFNAGKLESDLNGLAAEG